MNLLELVEEADKMILPSGGVCVIFYSRIVAWLKH